MNASEHIANRKAPRANGNGALPSQQIGLAAGRGEAARQPDLREVQIGEHRRAATTDRGATASDGPSRRRCRSRGRRRGAPCRATARTTAWRDDVGRIGEAIEEVAALEVRARARRRCRGTWQSSDEATRVESLRLRLVVEAEHRAPREVRPARLDVLARCGRRPAAGAGPGCRRRPERCSSGSRGCRRGSRRRRAGETARSTSVEPSAAVRTPEDVERLDARSCARHRLAQLLEHRFASGSRPARAGSARRRASAAGLGLVEPGERIVAGPSASDGSASAASLRGTQSRTSTTKVGGFGGVAERVGLDAPEARVRRRVPPFDGARRRRPRASRPSAS